MRNGKQIFTILIILVIASIIFHGGEEKKKINPPPDMIGVAKVYKMKELKRSRQSLGIFDITFYNGDGSAIEGGSNDCYGEPLRPGIIAVDPDVIPLGSTVWIDNNKYVARDVGGMINGNHIDMYMPVSQSELSKLGRQQHEVFIEVKK